MASYLRSWTIRGVILAVIFAIGYAVWFAATWVSPEKVRAALIAQLQAKFDDSVEVQVGEAHLRFFGGIAVSDLKLCKRGETEPFLEIPAAVIHHDKQRLQQGEMVVRKIEIERPTVRLKRFADNSWNLSKLVKPSTSTSADHSPTILIRDGTIFVEDQRPEGFPKVALTGVKCQVLNDPVTQLRIEGDGRLMAAEALGSDGKPEPNTLSIPLEVNVRVTKANGAYLAKVHVPDLPLNADLVPIAMKVHPKVGHYLSHFTAKSKLTIELNSLAGSEETPKIDVTLELNEGRFTEPSLPKPLENLSGIVRLQDGRVVVEKLSAKLGHAQAELTLRSRPGLLDPPDTTRKFIGPYIREIVMDERTRLPILKPQLPPAPECELDPLQTAERILEKFEISVNGLSLDDDLFAKLTPKAARIRTMFNPIGTVNVSLRYQHNDADGSWRREAEVKPNKLSIEYEHFRYRATELTGSLKKVIASDGTDEFQVNMIGSLGGRRVDISGKVAGEGPDPYVAIRIAGSDIPVDDKLFDALPKSYGEGLRKLNANGRGDFIVDLRRNFQVNRSENTFNIRVYNGRVNYKHFPYPFQQVRGTVLIRTTACDETRPLRPGMPLGSAGKDTSRVELKNFEAVHDGGRLWLSGENDRVAGSEDRKMTLRVQGENLPIDSDFRNALKELKLDGALATFDPKGELTFGADVEIWDRTREGEKPAETVVVSHRTDSETQPVAAKLPVEPPFNPITDLKLAFNFKGPTITPKFFQYEMHNFAGLLRYHSGRLEMVKMSAKHGSTELKLDAGEIRFGDGNELWANLGGITIAPFTADTAFLKALPEKLRHGFQELKLRGPADLNIKHLVVSQPAEQPAKPADKAVSAVARGQAETDDTLMTAPSPERPTPDRWRELGTPATSAAPGVSAPPATTPKAPLPIPVPPAEAPRLLPATVTSVSPTPIAPAPIATTTSPATTTKVDPEVKPASVSIPFTLPWSKPKPAPTAPTPAIPAILADPNPTILYWNFAINLKGASLELGVPVDEAYGSIACTGRYEGTHLGAVAGHAWIEKANISRQPITNTKLSYRVRAQQPDPLRLGCYTPPAIEIYDINGTCFQGTISGEARVVLAEPTRYRVWMTATGVKLEDLAKHYKLASGAELSGNAQAQFLLENTLDTKTNKWIPVGSGQIDVPKGRMYNLPVLLELVKVLKGGQPDGCAFEEAHATLELKGDRIKVTQLDLLGSAVSLGGGGELDTDGKQVKFEFYTIWSQTLKRWLSSPLGDVAGLLSGSLFKIELTRENGKLTPKAHMLPVVTDPVRSVAERLRNRVGQAKELQNAQPTVRAVNER